MARNRIYIWRDPILRLDQIVIPRRRSSIDYRIEAFDRRFDLTLIPSEEFLLSSSMDRTRENKECFYRGYVNKDFSSMISINACHGLVSVINNDRQCDLFSSFSSECLSMIRPNISLNR